MKSTFKFLAFPLLVAAASQSQAYLITNGSFEFGTNPGSFSTLGAGNTSITGWTIGGAGVDYIGSYWNASDGSRSIDLNGSNALNGVGNGSISQSNINVIAGRTYRLSFDLSGNTDNNDTYFELGVNFGSMNFGSFSFTAPSGTNVPSPMNWKPITYDFVANQTGSFTLTFSSTDPDQFYGPALDNVSMTEVVPEPFTMMLMGGAAVGAFAKVRRRRSAKLS